MTLFAMSLASRSNSGFAAGAINEYCVGLCMAGMAFLAVALFLCSKAPDRTVETSVLPRLD